MSQSFDPDIEAAKQQVEEFLKALSREGASKDPSPVNSDKDCDNDVVRCQEKALEEILAVKDAFIEFQKKIFPLAIHSFVEPLIEEFVRHASEVEHLIRDAGDQSPDGPLEKRTAIEKEFLELLFTGIHQRYFA